MQKASELEHTYQKAVRIFMHRHAMHTVPPPFNMLHLAWSALTKLQLLLAGQCAKLWSGPGVETRPC